MLVLSTTSAGREWTLTEPIGNCLVSMQGTLKQESQNNSSAYRDASRSFWVMVLLDLPSYFSQM